MTLADGPQNPNSSNKLAKSIDAITALRAAMEKRLKEAQEAHAAHATIAETTPPPQAHEFLAKIDEAPVTYDPGEWSRILFRIAERSQKLAADYMQRCHETGLASSSLDPAHIGEALTQLSSQILNDPQRFAETQVALWQGYAKIWQTALAKLQGQKVEDQFKPAPSDRRFQDAEWQSNWLFDILKQLYLLTAEQTKELVAKETAKLDPKLARKLEFATRQMADAMSPSNFWMTNPEVLRTVYKTGGESLIKGLENFLADLENGKGDLRIRMTDASAFKLGENIATTQGKVIYQNHLMQLIQYAPQTPEVRRTPLLILPPWINKFYILDLREKNSFIGYLIKQGYTVFCVSWVNPDERHAAIDFDDYMVDGALTAMREAARATGEKDINALGYCIGGTLLAATLAYLKAVPTQPPDLPEIKSATYLVAMTDFAEPGDLGAFIDDDLIKIANEQMDKKGFLDASTMATVFNLLRSNDLIWSYVVNNYLLGKDPTPFDILYWNSDSTNMPAAMQRTYIREMYKENNLVKPDAIKFKGVPLDLGKITTPSYLLSTREDHIAPWKSTYKATHIYQGPITFTLAASGHIAGIINPPASNKYGYWTNSACPADPEEWVKGAEEHRGSWWPEWLKWLENYAGEKVPAREVKNGLEDAPGSYVKVRAV